MDKGIILFDGVCNLCNGFINRVIDRDEKGILKFGSLQSDSAKTLLTKHGLSSEKMDSIILIHNGRVYKESDAVLMVANLLGYKALYHLRLIPKFLRDGVYKLIARNRYKMFGERDSCRMPTPELKDRFI